MRKIGGVLCFWGDCCDVFNVNFGELTLSTSVNDTPLALVFSLAGCFAFGDMDANFSM